MCVPPSQVIDAAVEGNAVLALNVKEALSVQG